MTTSCVDDSIHGPDYHDRSDRQKHLDLKATLIFYWPAMLILSIVFGANIHFFNVPLSETQGAEGGGKELDVIGAVHASTTPIVPAGTTNHTTAESQGDLLVCDKRPFQLCGAGRFKHPAATIGPHYEWLLSGHHQHPHHRDPSDSLIPNRNCSRAKTTMEQADKDRRSGRSRDITFVVLYYEEPLFLSHHVETWLSWPSDLRDRFNFLIIDDGSRAGLRAAELVAGQQGDLENSIHLEIYYIEQNLCWNIAGARNLAAFMAKTEYIFVCDADTTVPEARTAEYLLELRSESMELYNRNGTQLIQFHFDRFRVELEDRKPHPAVMLLSKKTYWMSGGCDENGFFTSGWFRKRANWQDYIEIVEVNGTMIELKVPPLVGLPHHPECPNNSVNCERMVDIKAGMSSVYGPKPTDQVDYWHLRENGTESWSNEFLRFSWHRAYMSNQIVV